jgi:EF-P beta-lysylation protein EpmB
MIPSTTHHCQSRSWKKLLAEAIRDPLELLQRLQLDVQAIPLLSHAALADFPLRVPEPYFQRIRKGDPHDPLLRQVLPLHEESLHAPDFVLDPVGDGPATTRPGLLQKYAGRALIISTGACPVHCRYCFRRHFPYDEARLDDDHWDTLIEHLQQQPEVEEVILSGGDPLSLSNDRLNQLSQRLTGIRHIKRLRIHTRMPVVIPQRVDEGLLAWLSALPWPISLVVHCNHAQEIDDAVVRAMDALRATGAILLNQSVLLSGVNDRAGALMDLSTRLFEAGILPYYLHMLDPVQGAAHFSVSDNQALVLMESLRRQLPGYLVPRLVREESGLAYKRPLSDSLLT